MVPDNRATVSAPIAVPPPAIIPIPAHAGPDRKGSAAEERWENEGGHLTGEAASRQGPTYGPPPGEIEDLATQVRVMGETLSSDYANGRVGKRYNTYAHRSRVLRQLAARLGDAIAQAKRGTPPS